jgi:glutamate racemase
MVFSYLEKKASQELNATIETKTFDENNLIEIKTDLNMPYVSDKDYENAYGETVIKGVHYQYVKRKIENNVLYLMCLPNDAKTVLVETKTNVEKNNAEAGNNNSKHKSPVQKILKSTQIEYIQNHYSYEVDGRAMITSSTLLNNRNNELHSLFTPLTPEQPPECLA